MSAFKTVITIYNTIREICCDLMKCPSLDENSRG